MVSGISLLLAAVLSAPASAQVSTPELSGVCDELNSDGEVAPADSADAEEPITPSVNCSEPPAVPAVVDCNDARMSFWVQEMIGTCDMPRGASTGMAAPKRERPSALCNGANCTHDNSPMRAAVRDADPTPQATANGLALRVVLDGKTLPRAVWPRLRSTFPPRLERPPRV